MDLTWLWFTAFVPRRRELISQSHPLADTVRMHLSRCQQLVSLKPLVKSACYRFNIFKLPRSRRLEPSRGGKTKRGAPCATPRRALTINHGCQSSCAPALRRGGNSRQSSTSSRAVMNAQASAQVLLIRGRAVGR